MLLDLLQTGGAVGGFENLVSGVGQGLGYEHPNGGLVLDA